MPDAALWGGSQSWRSPRTWQGLLAPTPASQGVVCVTAPITWAGELRADLRWAVTVSGAPAWHPTLTAEVLLCSPSP